MSGPFLWTPSGPVQVRILPMSPARKRKVVRVVVPGEGIGMVMEKLLGNSPEEANRLWANHLALVATKYAHHWTPPRDDSAP